jgi:hypothetical protein
VKVFESQPRVAGDGRVEEDKKRDADMKAG